ncbi:MAG: patatin-like phospholipase family protein [Candidatus Eisenbacteria bacterium]|uniref:Patatin-like phospholipase family protein n=1 Tax=Eiseniibacteriota bacterium TaxID=2212470 RepID=A0A956LXR1_UNCEI|nr:patatin-like phospholipase family protein [Candidatus Eisenbacteria bacterium]
MDSHRSSDLASVSHESAGAACRVGLALSGGAARSVAHIGVLKAFREAGIPIDALAGTSGGAVIAVLYASGLPIAELERVAVGLRRRDLGKITLSRMGIISIRPLESLLRSLIGEARLEELQPPTAIVATNLVRRARQVFRAGDAIQAVLASSAMPHIYRPVEVDGELYTDGSVVEYLPLSALRAYRPLVRVGVHLLPEEYRSRPRHLGHVVASIVNIIQRANALVSQEEADVLVRPAVAPFSPFELVNGRELIEAGYLAAQRQIPRIRQILDERQRWLGELGPGPHDVTREATPST